MVWVRGLHGERISLQRRSFLELLFEIIQQLIVCSAAQGCIQASNVHVLLIHLYWDFQQILPPPVCPAVERHQAEDAQERQDKCGLMK